MTLGRVLWLKRAATAMTLSVVCVAAHSASGPGASEEVLAAWADSTSVGDVAGNAIPNPAVELPASVNPGTRARASASTVRVRPISVDNDAIPAVALRAYQRAAVIMKQSDARCGLTWELLAAIGRVESDHGRFGGSSLDKQGVAAPAIIGLPLNGKNGTAKIRDTDAGVLDEDARHDRAVGPMQFIPSTWSVVGVDADGDSRRNPQDVDDAALAAAVHLCGGAERLDTPQGLRAAVLRYNHSTAYAHMVIDLTKQYAAGNYSAPPTTSTATQITPPTTNRTDDGPKAEPERDGTDAKPQPKADPGTDRGSASTRPDLETDRPGAKHDKRNKHGKRDGDGKVKSDPLPEVGSRPVEEKPDKKSDDPGTDPGEPAPEEPAPEEPEQPDLPPCEPGNAEDPESGECLPLCDPEASGEQTECVPACVDTDDNGVYNELDEGFIDADDDGRPDDCAVVEPLTLDESGADAQTE